MKQVIHIEDLSRGWIRCADCETKLRIPKDPSMLKVCPVCQRVGFVRTKIGDVPIDSGIAPLVGTEFFDESDYTIRRLRFYEVYLKMTQRLNQQSLKKCVEQGTLKLPIPMPHEGL
ncbi:MAG: hypothetical protein OXN25_01440 [Candidatus Poribacteria bacterium]|nr:hypothetical protein [Candidatus Poribacteria bacterium]